MKCCLLAVPCYWKQFVIATVPRLRLPIVQIPALFPVVQIYPAKTMIWMVWIREMSALAWMFLPVAEVFSLRGDCAIRATTRPIDFIPCNGAALKCRRPEGYLVPQRAPIRATILLT